MACLGLGLGRHVAAGILVPLPGGHVAVASAQRKPDSACRRSAQRLVLESDVSFVRVFGGARTPSHRCYRSPASASQCGGCGTEEGDVGAPRSHDTARSVERQLRVTRPTHRKLIAALALSCLPTTGIVAQSPLIGFWVRNAVHCASRTGPRCPAVLPWSGSWAPQLAIDVRGDTDLVSGPNNAFTQRVDTFMVDGRINRWLPGRRGFVRATTEPPERYGVGPPVSRPLLPGESWRASSDGRTLTHTVQRKAGADSISVTMTYRRLAG